MWGNFRIAIKSLPLRGPEGSSYGVSTTVALFYRQLHDYSIPRNRTDAVRGCKTGVYIRVPCHGGITGGYFVKHL